jgi:hypothetical protein
MMHIADRIDERWSTGFRYIFSCFCGWVRSTMELSEKAARGLVVRESAHKFGGGKPESPVDECGMDVWTCGRRRNTVKSTGSYQLNRQILRAGWTV